MSRKVILYIAVSIDGYIADKDGNVSWLNGEDESYQGDYGYQEFINNVDTVIMGKITYRQIITELSPNEWPYKNLKSYVFTHKYIKDNENITFLSCNIVSFIKDLKKKEGKNIWICGGSNIVNQLIKQNLIDEYYLSMIPVVLGEGIPLFLNHNPYLRLHLKQTNTINGILNIIYTNRRKS